MQRIIIYAVILGVFTILINLLKYDNNFKGLSYDSTILEVFSYVSCSLTGCGYVGVHPVTKIGKIVIILLSILKYIILIEILISVSPIQDNLYIFRGIEELIKLKSTDPLVKQL